MRGPGFAVLLCLACVGVCEGQLRQSQTRVLASWTNAYFGKSVALCDTVAVVGAYYDDIVSNNAGAAYIFEKQGTNWVQQAVLAASDRTNYFYFGWSVAVHGDAAVVGSIYANVSNKYQAGRAYVFARSGTNWVEEARLAASDGVAGDYFGCSVAIFSTTIVVGAHNDDSSRGSAYVFERQGGVWTQRVKLVAAEGLAGDNFGCAVSLHEATIVAGAYLDDLPGKVNVGSAYVFEQRGSNWVQQGVLTNADGAASDAFGISVSVYGTNAIVGARLHDVSGKTDAGTAYLFERQGTNWVQQAALTTPSPSNNDWFGYGVSIWNQRAVMVAPGYDSQPFTNCGAGFVFGRSGTNWVYQDILLARQATDFNYWLGQPDAVSAWGDEVIVGAQNDDERGYTAGAAYIFSAKANSSPVAADDGAETPEDTPVTISVLTNDSDADGQSLAITNYTLPAHGAVTVGNWTNFEYTPSENWNGTDSFTYVCSDGSFGLGTAAVTVVVAPVQDPPAAEQDWATIIGATSIAINVLANDWEPDGDPMSVTGVTPPDRGTASVLAGSTSVLYTAAARYPGAHAFQYDVADGQGNSNRGSVLVSVCVLASNAEGRVSPVDSGNEDQFGASVSVSGNRALVGAKLRDIPGTNNVGAVFVYGRSACAWTQQVMIPNPEPCADDVFGAAAALDGDTALVGVPYYDPTTNYNGGAAYVFVWDGANWGRQARLVAPEVHVGDYGGSAVALDGDRALVGAPYADDGDFFVSAGGAYLWSRSGTNWSLQETFFATSRVVQFGRAVALEGDTAVVGHPYDDLDTTNRGAGSVYVYARDGITWPRQANLTAFDAAQTDRFGWAVAVQSNTLAVGAPYDDVGDLADAGSVYVFNRSDSNWSFGAKLTASDADSNRYFGLTVAMQGDSLIVGAPYDDAGGASDAGSVYVFTPVGNSWIQRTKLIAPDPGAGDLFGAAVAVDGDTAAVGAPLDDIGAGTNQGSAYFFLLDADEDGLGDALEAGLGSSPYNPDTDDDTLSDAAEFISGTDPAVFTAPSNWFHAAASQWVTELGLVVSWPSLTGRLYRVSMATNLLGPGPWVDTDFGDVEGIGGDLRYTNTATAASACFRVDVRLKP